MHTKIGLLLPLLLYGCLHCLRAHVFLCVCVCVCVRHSEWLYGCVDVCKEIFPNGKRCWCNNNEWNDILGAFTICACSIKVYSIAWRPLSRWWRKCCTFVLVYFRMEVCILTHNVSLSLSLPMYIIGCVGVKVNEPLTNVLCAMQVCFVLHII